MKKIVFILCSIFAATAARSQVVIDHFSVGPYEVDYKGKGDINYRLKKDMNLYEYFGLKKDTLVMVPKEKRPVRRALELGLAFSSPRFGTKGAFNSFGLYASGKEKIGNLVHLNYGGRVAVDYGHYNAALNYRKDVLFEVGVPLSVEFARLDRTQSSLFANIGFIPVYYTTLSAKEPGINSEAGLGKTEDLDIAFGELGITPVHSTLNAKEPGDNSETEPKKADGFYIAPKVEAGGYVPVGGRLLKIGVFGEYRIVCSKGKDDIFKQRIGRAFVGANIGLVF